MQTNQPIRRDLVLVGGGHSHAIALKQFGMKPLAGVRLTLISDVSHTPYSGMLPAYVAGLYDFDDCHIDLRQLSRFADAVMVLDRAVGLDLANHRVLLADHPPIHFDLLSLDLGSTPALTNVAGADAYAIPVKPISRFLCNWDDLVATLEQHPSDLRLAIVGGGAGGVELALAVQARLRQVFDRFSPAHRLEVHLLHRGHRLIPERSDWLGQRVQQWLQQRGVLVHLNESVAQITANAATDSPTDSPAAKSILPKKIHCESGLTIEADQILWVTQATAANWLAESGLATDERGFVLVNDYLQSVSHPQVFAAGDVATMLNHARPKAGVFAVRQGKPLTQNLRRKLNEQPLRPFVPQREFLILIGTGDRAAIASRGKLGFGPRPLFWRWKDSIDRQFMQQFSHLQPMQANSRRRPPFLLAAGATPHSGGVPSRPPFLLAAGATPHSGGLPIACVGKARNQLRRRSLSVGHTPDSELQTPHSPCAGCGSKVGSTVLERALSQLEMPSRPDVLVGLERADDAAVIQVPAHQVIVQTVDHFRALVNDPYLFGQICANHCLSDLFAMNATPQSALAIVTLPYATPAKLEATLVQLLAGAVKTLSQAGAVLVGGHTAEGAELAFGLTCNGFADPDQLWRKGGMQPDQALILTKALGTGTLFAAEMQFRARGRWIETAIDSMLQSNQAAVKCLRQFGATACTDVTGFGLAGHLLELMRASQIGAELDFAALPILPGAAETLEQGIVSSLHPQNVQIGRSIKADNLLQNQPIFAILFDPQTSGGLLATVPIDQAANCVTNLHNLGYTEAKMIGRTIIDDLMIIK